MKIELKQIKIRDLVKGYEDDEETSHVVAYDGKLDVRPAFQREFVYKDAQRIAVIDSIKKHFPLNVMYWGVRDDGTYEVIDGQQRTIAICQYYIGEFSYNGLYFNNLQENEKEEFLDYDLMIYTCEGNPKEKLDWFEIINIAGEKLTQQELLNAVFFGPWLSDAKQFFSKKSCVAAKISSDYVDGSPIRQEILETALKWISKGNIREYMATHQHKPNANELRAYFKNVIEWINNTFRPTSAEKKFMKGLDWGTLYNEHKDDEIDFNKCHEIFDTLILDDDVTKKKGIFPYIITGEEKYLSIRDFSTAIKMKVYKKQKGLCAKCGKPFKIEDMEGDHIDPWSKGGHTTEENCQMLCVHCNRRKSAK